MRTDRPASSVVQIATAALLSAPLFALMVDAGGGWAPSQAPAWTVVVLLSALVTAATLSTYVPTPGSGLRRGLGCSPCAATSALSALGAVWLLALAPHQVTMALTALALVSYALAQRVIDRRATCGI